MSQKIKRIGVILMAGLVFAAPVYAKKATRPVSSKYISSSQYDDRVIAHVGSRVVITMRQLNRYIHVRQVLGILSGNTMQDALNSYINDILVLEFADKTGIQVPPQALGAIVQQIASSNGITVEKLAEQLQSQGVSWAEYLDYIREEKILRDVKQNLFQNKINITEHDIDVFLKQYPQGVAKHQYQPIRREIVQPVFVTKAVALRDILLPVSVNASQEEDNSVKAKAEDLRRQILSGVSFADIAKRFSTGATAGQGGDLGIRLVEDWPNVFVKEIAGVPDRGITKVFRAPNGYHILQVVERRGLIEQRKHVVVVSAKDQMRPLERLALSGKTIVQQEVDTRHILVKFSPVMNDEKAKAKIDKIYSLLMSGESFEKLAQKYSDDLSAPEGGNLGWIDIASLDPAYAKKALELPLNKVSSPFRTQFGWHIVEVFDRKTEDKTEEVYRTLARNNLFNERSTSVFKDWLSELRAQNYVQIDLGK